MKAKTARDYAEFLKAGRWFGELPADLQEALLAAGSVRALSAGERLFARGDPPTGLFAVLEGAVRITGSADTGKEALLMLAEPPTWFGEIAVFDGLARTHDAYAQGEVLLLHLPQAALVAALDAHPRRWRHLALLLTAKTRLMFAALEEAALLPPSVRVARRLAWMAEGYGEWKDQNRRILELNQEALASMLSVSRQTVNQLLKDLEARGLVQLSYGKIEILDLAGLRAAGT